MHSDQKVDASFIQSRQSMDIFVENEGISSRARSLMVLDPKEWSHFTPAITRSAAAPNT
jgi:hypothetical protein